MRAADDSGEFNLWEPGRIFGEKIEPGDPLSGQPKRSLQLSTIVLVVLNVPVDKNTYIEAFRRSAFTVAADGGANHIYRYDEGFQYAPNALVGDLDSVDKNVLERYVEHGVDIYKDESKYAPDSTKSLRYTSRKGVCIPSGSIGDEMRLPVLILGGLGGRADQAFSQLQQLYLARDDPEMEKLGDLYLMVEKSLVWLLEKGRNVIRLGCEKSRFGESVGIIPLGEPALITTKGLEWDVTDWRTSFGSNLSTSNHVRADEIIVKTDVRVLFMLELNNMGG